MLFMGFIFSKNENDDIRFTAQLEAPGPHAVENVNHFPNIKGCTTEAVPDKCGLLNELVVL